MDFLDIRKKAKERARDRAAEPGAAAPDAAARLRELPVSEERSPSPAPAEPPIDERFTTWRPGDGAPPFVPPPPPFGPLAPAPDDDFTVIAASAAPAPPPVLVRPAPGPRPPLDPLDDFFYRPDEEAPELPPFAPPSVRGQEHGVVLREEYLTFLLGRDEYAVAIRCVREIIKAPPVTEVPRAPAHVLGVVTVRGEVVAVIDPRRRLALGGAAPAEGEGKVVILDAADGPCGLLVDRVANVVRLAPGSIEPCPQGLAGQSSDCVAGIGREGERIFTVLDLAGLLRRTPARGADALLARRADASA